MAEKKTLKDVPPPWSETTWGERLSNAATALSLWGLLTTAERERVHGRLMKRAINERVGLITLTPEKQS